jgi:hypothetical protein
MLIDKDHWKSYSTARQKRQKYIIKIENIMIRSKIGQKHRKFDNKVTYMITTSKIDDNVENVMTTLKVVGF